MEQKVQGKETGGEGRGTDASPAKEISLRYENKRQVAEIRQDHHSIKRVVVFLLLRIQNMRGKIKPQFFLIKSSVFSAMSLIDTLL